MNMMVTIPRLRLALLFAKKEKSTARNHIYDRNVYSGSADDEIVDKMSIKGILD